MALTFNNGIITDDKGQNMSSLFANFHPNNVINQPVQQPVAQPQQASVQQTQQSSYDPNDVSTLFSPLEAQTINTWSKSGNKTLMLKAQDEYWNRINQVKLNQLNQTDQKNQQAQQNTQYNNNYQLAKDEQTRNMEYNKYLQAFKPNTNGGFLGIGSTTTKPLTIDQYYGGVSLPSRPVAPIMPQQSMFTNSGQSAQSIDNQNQQPQTANNYDPTMWDDATLDNFLSQ